jgi:hypothetical protein
MISMTKHMAAASNVQFAQVLGKVTLADGTECDEMVLDHHESWGHKLRRIGRKLAPFLIVGLLAGAALKGHQAEGVELLAPLPAATVITNAGKAIAANRMINAGTVPQHVAWGTGAGTAAAADTTLFTESTEETRTSGTTSRVTTTVTNDTMQVVGTITVATSGKTITNVGLFDASTTGNLYFKSDFTGLALAIGDSIAFTIKVAFS